MLKGQENMNEVIDFLLHVAASAIGILVGAWLARKWDEIWIKIRRKRR